MNITKQKYGVAFAIPAICSLLVACDDNTTSYRDTSQPVLLDFNSGQHSFSAIFSDYPQGQETFYELDAKYQALPSPFENSNGFRLYGRNRSDDLFMGVYGKIDNLRPAQSYDVTLTVTIISNVPSNCVGIGGAPGESVYIKVASNGVMPQNILDDEMYRLDWDIGSQSQNGEHSQVVGDISNGIDCIEEMHYVEKKMVAEASIPVIADDIGDIWLMVGSDSGFEGSSELLIKDITVSFNQ